MELKHPTEEASTAFARPATVICLPFLIVFILGAANFPESVCKAFSLIATETSLCLPLNFAASISFSTTPC